MNNRSAVFFQWGIASLVLILFPLSLWHAQRRFGTREDVKALEKALAGLAQGQAEAAKRLLALERPVAECQKRLEALEKRLARERGAASAPAAAPNGEAKDGLAAEIAALRQWLAELQSQIDQLQGLAQANPLSGLPAGAIQPEANRQPPTTPAGSNPGAVQWSVEQVLGEPDTLQDGDSPTAWAPRSQDGGLEWIEAEFAQAVAPTGILIRETCNPGGVVKVEAMEAGGKFHTVWQGEDPTQESPGDFVVPTGKNPFATSKVRIAIDTQKKNGWEEIDAIGLVAGRKIYWAAGAAASSSYAEVYGPAPGGEDPGGE